MAEATKSKKRTRKASEQPLRADTLAALETKLAADGFTKRVELEPPGEGRACSMVWGTHKGIETPRVFLLSLPPGDWQKANAEHLQQLSWTQAPTDIAEEQYPKFAVVGDGEHEAIFDLEY